MRGIGTRHRQRLYPISAGGRIGSEGRARATLLSHKRPLTGSVPADRLRCMSASTVSVLAGDGDQQSRGKVRAGELEFVSRATAARMIARSTRTIYRLCAAGELTALYPEGGRYCFFRRSEVERYIWRRRSQALASA